MSVISILLLTPRRLCGSLEFSVARYCLRCSTLLISKSWHKTESTTVAWFILPKEKKREKKRKNWSRSSACIHLCISSYHNETKVSLCPLHLYHMDSEMRETDTYLIVTRISNFNEKFKWDVHITYKGLLERICSGQKERKTSIKKMETRVCDSSIW